MKFFIPLILSSFFFVSCNPNSSIEKQYSQRITSLTDSLTLALNIIERESVIPGFSVGIINQEEVIYQKGFGYSDLQDSLPFDTQTVNFVASVAKTFIGVAIMQLVENNQLDLEEAINDILPYKVVNPHFPDIPITVRHLVNHTSTLNDDFDPEDVGEADIFLLEEIQYQEDSIKAFMDEELAYFKLGTHRTLDECMQRYLTENGKWYSDANYENYPPGTKYSYSNIGAELAARIVEIKSGIPFNEYTKKYIFEPLKMKNTVWFYKNANPNLVSKIYISDNRNQPTRAIEHPKYQYAAYPSGDLKTNIEDWSNYLIEMIKGSSGKGTILNEESYRILFTGILTEDFFGEERSSFPLDDEYNVGVFWAISPTGLRLHNGGSIGVFAFMYFNLESKSGAIGFCNLPDNSFGKIRDLVYEYEQKITLEIQKEN